jgi:hypothetical protein
VIAKLIILLRTKVEITSYNFKDRNYQTSIFIATASGYYTINPQAPHLRNQLVPHEEQDGEQQITFPDFELVACQKCRDLTSEDTLVPDLLYKLHCLVTHAEVDDRMAKQSKK